MRTVIVCCFLFLSGMTLGMLISNTERKHDPPTTGKTWRLEIVHSPDQVPTDDAELGIGIATFHVSDGERANQLRLDVMDFVLERTGRLRR